MNSFSNLFLFVSIFTVSIEFSQAVCPTECLHLGILNTATCSCDCYSAWEGTYCEKAKGNCATDQPSECGTTFTSLYCLFGSIATYCPQMCSHPACTCGYDECLNGGVFDPLNCQCDCPFGIYGKVCENLSQCAVIYECQNLGTFNPNTCACDCISQNYGGVQCETLTCNLPDPSFCSANSVSSCVAGNYIYSTCPQMCGRCATTTESTSAITPQATTLLTSTSPATITSTATTLSASTGPTTTTSCQQLTCENGHVFNIATCSCPCGTGFSGSTCMNYDCNTTPQPDALLFGVCDQLDCAEASVKGTCPHKCFCTSTTGGPSTTVAPTTTVAPATTTASSATTTASTTTVTTTTATTASTTTVTTTTATTATTTCPAQTCAYGLIWDTNTCSCPCRTGFSGTLCDTYNCNLTPTPDSALGFLCTALTCGNDNEKLICPFKCLCGSTTA